MGITSRIAYTQNTTGVQLYYMKKDQVSLMQVFQRHWHTGPYTKRNKSGYKASLHSYHAIKRIDRHMQAVGSS